MPAEPYNYADQVTLADDNYHSLGELFGIRSDDLVALEGFIKVQTNGLTMVTGWKTLPPTTLAGDDVVTGGGRTVGPVQNPLAGWRLNTTWFRNTTAGSNGTVVVNLVVVKGRP